MDAIVTARVPSGIKDQGRTVLEEIGATPTDLINAAYRYVLSERKLPQAENAKTQLASGTKMLSKEQREELQQRIRRTTFAVPSSFWADESDDDLLMHALEEKYCAR